jgi:hypothetical protein
MEPPSPARLYATAAGALLFVLGIVGFFYDASFSGVHDLEPAFAGIEVNAWFDLLYVGVGALGVFVAGVASRLYSLAVGVLFTLLGIVGWGTEWLHLSVGLLGLAAVLGTPRSSQAGTKPGRTQGRSAARSISVGKKGRGSEPRSQPTGEGP